MTVRFPGEISDHGTLGSDLLLTGREEDLEYAVADGLRFLGFLMFEPHRSKADMMARSDKTKRRYSEYYKKEIDVSYTMTMCVVEVKSSSGNIDLNSVRQLADWCDSEFEDVEIARDMALEQWRDSGRRTVVPHLKGILLSNWQDTKPVDSRPKLPYSYECIEFATRRNYNLLLTPDLHYTVEEVKQGKKDKQEVRNMITDGSGFTLISERMRTYFSRKMS